MSAKKARQQHGSEHPQQQRQQPAEAEHAYLDQLPLEVLQQVADRCAGPSTPAAVYWAPVSRTWRTLATATSGPPLSIACGKHLSPALHVRRHRSWGLGVLPATHHLPITPVLWACHRDISRVTSLAAWLRRHAASVPELEVRAVTTWRAELALSVRVYRQLKLDWADAHAALFEGLGAAAAAAAGGGGGGQEADAGGQMTTGAAAVAPAAEGGGSVSAKGAPSLTRLQLPGLGHVPAPTLAAGLAACPALESLSLPFTWPQWIKARTSPQASPLYEALRGLTRLVKLELGVEGLQAGDWQEEAAGATGAAGAAAAAGPEGGAGTDLEVPTFLHTVQQQLSKKPNRANLTPLFEGLPSSIQEVILTGDSLCKCTLDLRSLQHLSNLRQLQLPEYVVFEGPGADLAALTALTQLRGDDALSAGSEPLLRVPNLRRLVVPTAAMAAAGPLAALAQQQQLRELELAFHDASVLPRYEGEWEGMNAAEAAWEGLEATLPKLQQLTSLSLTLKPETADMPPSVEEPAAAIKQLVNLRTLCMPVEFMLAEQTFNPLPEGLTALTLTLGSGVYVEELLMELDPELLLPALAVLSVSDVSALKSVDFRPWSGSGEPPSQEQYDELQQGSQALPPEVKVLWGGTPLQQVVPLPAPPVPEAAAAAAAGGGAEGAAAGAGQAEDAAAPAAGAAAQPGVAAAAGEAPAAVVGEAAAAAPAGGDDVPMAEQDQGGAADA